MTIPLFLVLYILSALGLWVVIVIDPRTAKTRDVLAVSIAGPILLPALGVWLLCSVLFAPDAPD